MDSAFISGYQNLYRCWKELRQSINACNDIDALANVVNFWSLAPLSTRVLDWDEPASWPTPWEMLHLGMFDESALALGMYYTLNLSDDERWTPNRLQLILIRDIDRHVQKIILEVDKKWLLNYDYNCVVDASCNETNLLIQQRYIFDVRNKSFHVISAISSIKTNDKPVI